MHSELHPLRTYKKRQGMPCLHELLFSDLQNDLFFFNLENISFSPQSKIYVPFESGSLTVLLFDYAGNIITDLRTQPEYPVNFERTVYFFFEIKLRQSKEFIIVK